MTDYSQMSDFEINKAVADIAMNGTWHVTPSHPDNKTGGWLYGSNGIQTYPLPDYCNNPSDAWPIIVANHITIEWNVWKDGITRPYCHGIAAGTSHFGFDGNPLRAAMLAFLAMQDSSNANPI